MKRIFTSLMICAAALVSCSKIELGGNAGEQGVVLTLKMAGVSTKAVTTMPGVAELNENKIETINYYIFDETALLASGSKAVSADVDAEGIKVNLNFQDEQFATVFGAEMADRTICVVANAAAQLDGKTISSPSDLEALALTISTTGKQDSFVMMGTATIKEVASETDMRKATSEVSLKRVLAKISLKIDLATQYQKEGTDVTWTPVTSDIKVKFTNLMTAVPAAASALADSDVLTFTAGTAADGYYPCTAANPFYSYPRTWTISAEDQPYFLVTIPWTSSTNETRTTYYKVLLSNKSFESNNWYAVNVTLNGLGSLTPGIPVEVPANDLTIADWTDSVEGQYEYHTEATFTEARVLDIPQASVSLANTTSTSIAYITSNDCVISNVKLQMYNYKGESIPETPEVMINRDNNSTSLTLSHSSLSGVPNNDATFRLENNRLIFSHSIANDLSSGNFDYRDYYYVVTISHADNSMFSDQVTIIQRPALNILGIRDSNSSDKNPNTFINGYTSSNQSSGDNYKLVALSSGGNHNPNMYVIAASQLSSGSLTIGDPRTATVDNLGSDWARDGRDMVSTSTTRKIQKYYPTSNQKEIVAPKFRVASSYGKNSGSVTYDEAKKRCASFQEDGYPAGRWRVPTKAEVEFIITLSAKEYIPLLFSSNSNYWCATGKISPTSSGTASYTDTSSGSAFVRCVYDEWYWENTDYNRMTGSLNVFTWGDMER